VSAADRRRQQPWEEFNNENEKNEDMLSCRGICFDTSAHPSDHNASIGEALVIYSAAFREMDETICDSINSLIFSSVSGHTRPPLRKRSTRRPL